MASVTGYTAARMQTIEDETVVSGEVIGDDLFLERRDGVTFNAGNVRGPAGVGTTPDGPAGGALSGTYPNPGLADGAVSTAKLQALAVTFDKIANGTITLAKLSAALQELLVPTGVVLPYAAASAPAGFLLCGPTAVSRTGANAALFAKIGTAFGAGDGSTTFNLPNPQDRLFMGASGSKALASIGGAATAVLAAANLPPHAHSINHSHTIEARTSPSGLGASQTMAQPNVSGTLTTLSNVVNAFSGNSGNGPGSSTAFDILNPYLAMNFIIKL